MGQSLLLPTTAFWCACLLAAACCAGLVSADGRSPVVLVPGNGGSQLWAHLRGADSPWYCRRSSSADRPQQLWLEMSSLLYPAINCLAYNLMLQTQREGSFSASSTKDNAGVHSFVPGFGTVDTLLWISDWQSKYTAYYSTLVTHLVEKLGYIKNADIRGAPYDFRKAPDELAGYFQSLKELIDDSFRRASKRRVVLVAHSLGAKLTLHFLQAQSPEWKEKYIEHFVAIGGAFGGVTASLRALLLGYNLGIPLVDPLLFRSVQRSWPSTHYLLPDASVYGTDRPLVAAMEPLETPKTPSAVFTTTNLSALFSKAGFAKGYEEGRARYGSLTDVSRPPGVPTTCVFGDGLPTLARITWPDVGEGDVHESGDGTVAAATQRVCHDWAARQTARVRVAQLAGAQHMAMLSDSRLLSLVAEVAGGTN